MRKNKLFKELGGVSLAIVMLTLLFGLIRPERVLAAPEAYVLGVMVPLSGPGAKIGECLAAGAALGAEEINAKGGINGIPVKLINGDHGAKPDLGVRALRKLIEVDKILMTMGSWSSVIAACAPICDQYKVMQFNTGGTSPFLLNLGPYSWSILSTTLDEDRLLLRYLIKEMGKKRIGLVWNNDVMGKAHLEVFQKLVPKYGGVLVGELPVDEYQIDFESEVAKARRWNADYIYVTMSGNAYAWIQKAGEKGLKGIPFGTISPVIGEEPVQKAILATGMTAYVCPADMSEKRYPNIAKFREKYKVKTGIEFPSIAHLNSYDYVYIAAEIIKLSKAKGGDYLTGERLREALVEKRTFNGGSGIATTFDIKTGGCSKPMSFVKGFRDPATGKFKLEELTHWTTEEIQKIREE